MKPTSLVLIGMVLFATSGCSLWKKSGPPAPTKQQIVLHGIVDFDKAAIRPESMTLLEEAATQLNEHGNLGVVVEGHTDATGSLEYNQKLSLQRAEAVRKQLVKLGVDPNRIVTIGKGASQPIASNDTPEGRAKNRRVVLVVYQP